MGMTHLVEKWMVRLTFVALGGTVAAAGAQGATPQLSGNGIVPDAKEPYAKMFRALQDARARQDLKNPTPSTSSSQKTRVVCGMVVVPVTPSADPKMVVQQKKDPKLEYSIRKIPPQVCNE
jgi:hypothetical protein